MILHTFVGSPNVRKVEALILHLNLSVQVVHHDFPGGALKTAQFRAINPNGMVPVLVDGSFILWESNAIMQYLADLAGETTLYPRDARVRADINRWQFWEQRHFNRAFGTLAFELVAKPHLGMQSDNDLIDIAVRDLARFAPVLETALSNRQHIVSDRLTIADYSLTAFESYRTRVPFDWSVFPNINAYFDRVSSSAAWQAASQANEKVAA
jgi:glutathione S-transferase